MSEQSRTEVGLTTQTATNSEGSATEPADDIYAFDDDTDLFFGRSTQSVNWETLPSHDARRAWTDLDAWVHRIRRAYGLPPNIIPPLWHRHRELVWELSALHAHWVTSYEAGAPPSAAVSWHRDFAEARGRLREWVAACGTKVDRDRPTRQVAWPGEAENEVGSETVIEDRRADFLAFVDSDVAARRAREEAGGLDDFD